MTLQTCPPCLHFSECSGCSTSLVQIPPVWEDVCSFFGDLNPPILHQETPKHWRHRAKVAVRGTCGSPIIGLFKEASHDVFPIPNCLVHHPHLNQAFEMIRQWMVENQLTPYQEKTGQGDLRYLQGVVERRSKKVQLTFVLNTPHQGTPKAREWQKHLQQLAKDHPPFWHSLWLNFNISKTNNIFGPHWELISGEELLWESFNGVEVCYGAASFGQANLPLFEQMLIDIGRLIPKEATVAEFYAGVGAIGLCLADQSRWVRCSEINPHAEAYFNQARARLPPPVAEKLTFYPHSTQDALQLLEGASTVIVDPPRKGLDAPLFPALQANRTIEQLIYISCGWESFKKDCQRLTAQGWSIASADGYHFFPGSNHVELLVHFKRQLI